jgi:stage V sporulation protein S
MKMIKVAANSKTAGVAGAIAHSIRENGYTQVQGIGPGAVNQMIKATIIAKRFLSQEGTFIRFTPTYAEVNVDGQERTALRLTITSSLMPEETAVPETTTAECNHRDT